MPLKQSKRGSESGGSNYLLSLVCVFHRLSQELQTSGHDTGNIKITKPLNRHHTLGTAELTTKIIQWLHKQVRYNPFIFTNYNNLTVNNYNFFMWFNPHGPVHPPPPPSSMLMLSISIISNASETISNHIVYYQIPTDSSTSCPVSGFVA